MKTAKNNTTQYVLRTASLYVVIVAPSPLLWYYFTDRHTTFNCNKKLLHVEYLLNVYSTYVWPQLCTKKITVANLKITIYTTER